MRGLILTSSTLLACSPRGSEETDSTTFTSASVSASADDGSDTTAGDTTTAVADSTGSDGSTTVQADTSDTGSDPDVPNVCGDGMLGPDEPCDGDLFGEMSCQAAGFNDGVLVCDELCQGYSTAGCYNCGNGTVEPAEDCEEELPSNFDCADAGYTEGEISCNLETCQYDVTNCSLCGNDTIEGDEVCDGDQLADSECASVGFESGTLSCTDECSYDYSGCEGGGYSQNFDGAMIPPEFEHGGDADWVIELAGLIVSPAAASGDIADDGTSSIDLDVVFSAAGTVAFTHAESTEGCCDYLEFWVDNTMVQSWSGITTPAMTPANFEVAAGPHTLSWRYTKDYSVSTGEDQVWVDDIVLTNGAPSP